MSLVFRLWKSGTKLYPPPRDSTPTLWLASDPKDTPVFPDGVVPPFLHFSARSW